jgi:hypothetical protein
MENEDCKVEIAPLINCNCWKCRYQPPLPADQVKPMAEFDYEGGEVSINDLFFSLVQHSCFLGSSLMTGRSLVVPSFCTDLFDRQSSCHNCLEFIFRWFTTWRKGKRSWSGQRQRKSKWCVSSLL